MYRLLLFSIALFILLPYFFTAALKVLLGDNFNMIKHVFTTFFTTAPFHWIVIPLVAFAFTCFPYLNISAFEMYPLLIFYHVHFHLLKKLVKKYFLNQCSLNLQ